jgi:hypothetical protein
MARASMGFFRDAVGKLSMSRVIAFIGAVAGAAVAIVGVILAAVNSGTEALVKADKDIIVAGLAVFSAGGITKAVNRIGEGLDKKKNDDVINDWRGSGKK